MTPFDIWAPILRAPFSGDVTQEIIPRIFSPDIKGIPEIEQRVLTEVASYGKQLGKVMEALQILATKTGADLPEIDKLVAEVKSVKETSLDAIRQDATEALARLKQADEEAWRGLVGRR